MFDFGAGELVVIGVVALVAIGPKELPGVLRTVGQVVGRMRRMAGDFQNQFNDAMREAELGDAQKLIADIKSDMSGVAASAEISTTPAAVPVDPLVPEKTVPVDTMPVTSSSNEETSTLLSTDVSLEPSSEQLTLIPVDETPVDEAKPKRKRTSKKTVAEEEPT
jgi:sec-independent protein translocase protein TatB